MAKPKRPPTNYDKRTHYTVIGVAPCDEVDAIHDAYRALALCYHPDLVGESDFFKDLTGAWAVLKDKKRRKEYDDHLAFTNTACLTCKGRGVVFKKVGFTQRVSQPCEACAGCGYLI